MTTNTNPATTDRLGFTEREWENLWTSTSQDDGAQTAHSHRFEAAVEAFCEGCDSDVDYSNGYPGVCGCE